MPFLAEADTELGFFTPASVDKRGADLVAAYKAAQPFPHIVIDDFLPPELLESCIKHLETSAGENGVRFDREQERYKSQYNPDLLSPNLRALFYSFNSRPFIKVLENITGIKGLIPDPFFLGAGLHETTQGGHLSIHADFNHHKPMDLERRINVLIYLNKDWKPEYGGQLELWDKDMANKIVEINPIFNRCVIFNTDTYSYHGNPQPVNHPGGIPRRSIALYYYTSTWLSHKREHSTLFQVRAQSADRPAGRDWRGWARTLAVELLPPAMYRALSRARGERE
jgi:Rps23 Pro-64 3,4-dihydroxylase Tpa1-like proline 4-hydroxylase